MENKYLYHYTSANGLINIILHQKLWATDIDFQNDHNEGKLAKKHLSSLCAAKYRKKIDPYIGEVIEYFLSTGRTVFASSFSMSTRDNLSLYRTYTPPDGGYSIGFERSYLDSILNTSMIDCIYDHKDQITLICEFIESLISEVNKIRKSIDKPYDAINKLFHVTQLPSNFGKYSACFKPEEFSSEKESRIVVEKINVKDTMYRTSSRKNVIIPYMEISLPNTEEARVSISLGPNSNHDIAVSGYQHLTFTAMLQGCNWNFITSGGSGSSYRFL